MLKFLFFRGRVLLGKVGVLGGICDCVIIGRDREEMIKCLDFWFFF